MASMGYPYDPEIEISIRSFSEESDNRNFTHH